MSVLKIYSAKLEKNFITKTAADLCYEMGKGEGRWGRGRVDREGQGEVGGWICGKKHLNIASTSTWHSLKECLNDPFVRVCFPHPSPSKIKTGNWVMSMENVHIPTFSYAPKY